MRFINLIMAVVLMVSGISAAHAAFGEIVKCPSGMVMAVNMADCCDHGAKDSLKGSCAKCDFCCAVTAAITPVKLQMTVIVTQSPATLELQAIEQSALYPLLRPPNPLV